MDIPALLAALVSAKELAGSLVSERDARKLAAIHHDLTERLTHAQLKLAEVVHVLGERTALAHALENRVRELEQKDALRHRYELAELVPGTFAYRLKPLSALPAGLAEPAHFICQPCLDARAHRIVLQRKRIDRRFHWSCAACDFSARIES